MLALGLTWLVQQYVVKSYRIPTGSMRPTIDEGDRVLAARFLAWFADPERGDVIVFHPPGVGDVPQRGARTEAERDVHQARRRPARRDRAGDQRAGPGLPCAARRLPRAQRAVRAQLHGRLRPVTVPRDAYFVLGDNRVSSEDSRIWGTLPKRNVIGTAFVRYWPPRRFGIL